MGEPEMDREFGDFFHRDFSDFSEDSGGGGGGMGGPGFRGGRGGGPWRGGRGGRGGGGHFDNGFGPRGPPPRFRGRGGFMGPNMRGPGPRGPPGPGFRGGGHFERQFRGQGWNNGPPPHHMGHMGGGAPDHSGPSPSNNNDSQDTIWAEARTETGTVYYYNTKTRVTSWERPEGAGIRIMSHEEWSATMAMKGPTNEGPRFGGPDAHNTQSPGFQGQSPPQNQNQNFGPRPQSGTPTQNSPMQGPPGNPSPVRPPMQMGGPPGANPFNSSFRPPGTNFSPGENGVPSSEEKQQDPAAAAAIAPKVPNATPQRPAQQQQPPISQQPPGFPPFGPMTTPPPFGLPFPQNFAMVPPPWNPLAGVPPPTGVPPPLIAPMDPLVQHIDPQVVARAFEWSEHMAPDGKAYYFNAKSQASVWEKPPPLIEFETAKVIAQQRLMQQAMMNASKDKLGERHDSNMESAKLRENEARRAAAMNEKCRPISSTPVSGTPWCVVWTGDKRVFFYNPSTKSSVWEKPPELLGRLDVDELLKASPAAKSIPLAAVKKAEATSTTEQPHLNSAGNASIAIVLPTTISNAVAANAGLNMNIPEKSDVARPDNKIIINIDKRGRDKDEGTENPPEKKAKKDSETDDDEPKEVITIEDEEKVEEKKDPLKEANALEAEVKAARERATVPLETRLQQFKEMLIEKQVSAFSTWEKELHKIVFDSRYLLLTSKERKAAFDNYVRERALEERKERKTRLAQVRERFVKFLEDINVNQKMSYNEFTQKYSRDERYKAVGKTRDREIYFAEFIGDLKRREREAKTHKKDKVKEDFLVMLKDKVKDYHLKWMDVKKRFDDPKFDILDSEEKEDLFRAFQKKLKLEIKYKERKKKKKMKKEKREKEKAEKSKSENKDDKELEEGESEPVDGSGKSDGPDSDNKMEDVSDEEEEEGVISDDSDDEDRARRERAEISMREREKEVQRTLASHLRDRDKEREFYRHEEAVQEFQALLTDLVRSSEISWREAKKNIKRDRRWESISILSREEMEDIFNQHCDNIARKKKLRFRDLLQEARVKLNSNWKDVRKKIRDDPRFQKYSSDERKCEREFSMYLKDLATTMKSDFRALLKETKMLTYKTKHHIRENPQIIRDIEALLEKDKRFLNLDSMSDERQRLLAEYLDELERKGPPPPPTASEPSRRLK